MATEIQRILIKYEADIKELKTGLDTVQRELKDTEKAGDKATKSTQKGFNDAGKSAQGFSSILKSVGAAIAAAYSVREIIQFTKESVRLADVQLKAEAQLLTALKGRKGAQQELIKQAADLQKKTTFGDEETIAAQARIAAFVQEVDQIKELTRVSQDFASAKGIDLATASDLITKSFASSTNALSRYGIEIEGTAGSSERLTNIVKGLDNAFKGQAEVIARTGLGPLIQLQNAIGDIREEIGKAILNELPGFTAELTKAVNITAEFTKQLFDAEQRTGTIGSAASTTQKAIDALTKSFELLTEPMNQVISLFKSMSFEIPGTGKEINLFEGYIKGVGIVLEQLVTRRIENAIKAFQYLGAGIQGVRAALVPGGETFIEAFNRSLNESRGIVGQQGSILGDEFGNSFGKEYVRGIGFAASGKTAEEILAEVLDFEKSRGELKKDGQELGAATGAAIVESLQDVILSFITDFDLSAELDRIGLSTDNQLADFYKDRIDNLAGFRRELEQELSKKTLSGVTQEEAEDIRVLGTTTGEYLANIDQAGLDRADSFAQSAQAIIGLNQQIAGLISDNEGAQKSAALLTIGLNTAVSLSEQSRAIASAIALGAPLGPGAIIGLIATIVGFFAQVTALSTKAKTLAEGFAVGTSNAPGGEAWVGEKGPERMYVPKGARIYTSEASKKEGKLIDALNAGKHEDFIYDHYLKPFALQLQNSGGGNSYDDFQLRQAVKGNKVVKIHPESLRQMKGNNVIRYR